MRQVDYKNGKIFSNVMQSMLPMLVAQVLSLSSTALWIAFT